MHRPDWNAATLSLAEEKAVESKDFLTPVHRRGDELNQCSV